MSYSGLGLKAVSCIKTDVPTFGERAVGIFRSIISLSTIKKRVEKIFPAEGKLPILSKTLSDIEV